MQAAGGEVVESGSRVLLAMSRSEEWATDRDRRGRGYGDSGEGLVAVKGDGVHELVQHYPNW